MTQVDEAIERLRADVDRSDNDDLSYVCSQQYETDIRALLAEVERLREALVKIANSDGKWVCEAGDATRPNYIGSPRDVARAALQPQGEK